MATNPQTTFDNAANATSGYAQGFAAMQQYLAEQASQNTAAWLQQQNIDPSAYLSQSQFPTGVLNAAYGTIPAEGLSQQGQAFGAAFGAMPSIFQGQLAYNQGIQAQELAHAQRMSSSGGSSGGGEDGGLTPYQQVSLALRADEIAYDRGRDAAGDDMDWMKFQYDIEKDEQEAADKEAQANADAMLYMAVLNPELLNDKKFMKQLMNALGAGSSSAAGALTGAITEGRENEAETASDAADARKARQKELRQTIVSAFEGLETGVNKNQAIQSIMSAISTEFPSFAGFGRQRVQTMVRNHVNRSWANRNQDSVPNPSVARGKLMKDVRGSLSTLFDDYIQTNPVRAHTTGAIAYVMDSLRDKFGARKVNKNRAQIQRIVRRYVDRNKGKFRRTFSSNGGAGGPPPPPPRS